MNYNYLSLYFGALSQAKLEKKQLQRKKRKKVVFLSRAETAEIADSTKSIMGIVAALRQHASRHCERSEAIQTKSFFPGLLRRSSSQ